MALSSFPLKTVLFFLVVPQLPLLFTAWWFPEMTQKGLLCTRWRWYMNTSGNRNSCSNENTGFQLSLKFHIMPFIKAVTEESDWQKIQRTVTHLLPDQVAHLGVGKQKISSFLILPSLFEQRWSLQPFCCATGFYGRLTGYGFHQIRWFSKHVLKWLNHGLTCLWERVF